MYCQQFAEVTVAGPSAAPVELPIDVGRLTFSAVFQALPGVATYHVSLDRLWFWAVGRSAGLRPRLATERLGPGLKVALLERAARADILY